MRRNLFAILAVLLAVLFVSTIAMAGTLPGTGIKGTYHDLSTKGLSTGYGGGKYTDAANGVINGDEQTNLDRICVYCHAPHNTLRPSDNLGAYLPLWNHGITTNKGSFIPYTHGSNGPDEVGNANDYASNMQTQPGAVSLLCLSCHDGSISTNVYGGTGLSKSFGNNNASISSNNRASIGFGGDYSNHHPIGFNFVQAAAMDDEMQTATQAVFKGSGHGGIPVKVSDVLYNGKMECATCHDVHNTKNAGTKFIYTSDYQSGFCLTCHLKGGVNKQ